MFLSSLVHFLPPVITVGESFCNVLCFQAHKPTLPSSSPPGSESLFVMCHVSKLTKPLVNLFIAPFSYHYGPSKICHRTILLTLSRPPSPHYLLGPSLAYQGDP